MTIFNQENFRKFVLGQGLLLSIDLVGCVLIAVSLLLLNLLSAGLIGYLGILMISVSLVSKVSLVGLLLTAESSLLRQLVIGQWIFFGCLVTVATPISGYLFFKMIIPLLHQQDQFIDLLMKLI